MLPPMSSTTRDVRVPRWTCVEETGRRASSADHRAALSVSIVWETPRRRPALDGGRRTHAPLNGADRLQAGRAGRHPAGGLRIREGASIAAWRTSRRPAAASEGSSARFGMPSASEIAPYRPRLDCRRGAHLVCSADLLRVPCGCPRALPSGAAKEVLAVLRF
jgi:hypothetical protein